MANTDFDEIETLLRQKLDSNFSIPKKESPILDSDLLSFKKEIIDSNYDLKPLNYDKFESLNDKKILNNNFTEKIIPILKEENKIISNVKNLNLNFIIESFKDLVDLPDIKNEFIKRDLFAREDLRSALRNLLLRGDTSVIDSKLKELKLGEVVNRAVKIQVKKIEELKGFLLEVYNKNVETRNRISDKTESLESIKLAIEENSKDKSSASLTTLATELYQARKELMDALESGEEVDVDKLLKSAYALLKKGEPFKSSAESLIEDIYSYELGQIEKNAYLLLLDTNTDSKSKMKEYVNQCKKRPSVGGFNYTEKLKNRYDALLEFERSFTFYKNTPEILEAAFINDNTSLAIKLIEQKFDEETEADIALLFYELLLDKEERKQPKVNKSNGKEFLDSVNKIQSIQRKTLELKKKLDPNYEFNERLERNLPAFYFLSQQFREVIVPLFQSLIAKSDLDQISDVFGRDINGITNREKFIIRMKALQEQRDLSDIEKDYLMSVEILSSYNPHLIALLRHFPGETSVYIENYIKQMSEDTFDRLEDGQYVKLVQIGKGPNGVASAGEIVRKRPDLAQDCLYFDAAEQAGGPFAVPRGPAWKLNSASSYSESTNNIPDPSSVPAEKTVRAFGSPLRWYPGERARKEDVREGSINQSVDYLPSPDNISFGRYPDNEVEASLLQLCDALLTKKQSFSTRVIGRESVDDDKDGNTLLTIQKTYENGKVVTKQIRTDNLIVSSGLGEDYFGFELENTRAQTVLNDSNDTQKFPRLSSTLNGFKALANRNKKKPEPGENLVIYGNGNSCDTLLEYISAQFEKNNKLFRNIRKIYIVTTGELSQRPRYAANNDVFARNGMGNLVEFVNARVSDVGYKDDNRSSDEDLVLYKKSEAGDEGVICDSKGKPIYANSVIAATGFRSKLLKDLNIKPDDLEDITLPTNSDISIAQRLKSTPNTVIVGTGSNSGFSSLEKLLQLPESSREALLRNGAENAVAKGFRGPDVQAAIRLFLENIPVAKESLPKKGDSRKAYAISLRDENRNKPSLVKVKNEKDRPVAQNNVEDLSGLLSAILVQSLPKLKVSNEDISSLRSHSVDIEVKYENNKFSFSAPNQQVEDILSKVFSNSYFQTYALEAMEERRQSSKFEVHLNFKFGNLNSRETYVQAI